MKEDWFTLRVSDGSLYDDIEVHAFFDRRQTVVNVRDKLPPIFTGEFLSYEFSVFSNDGYDLLDAKVLSGPSWVNQLVSDGQPNEWMKSFTLTGMIPEGSEGEQEVIIEVSNPYGNYKEVFKVIIPIISRNRDMSGVKISILEESENIYEQHKKGFLSDDFYHGAATRNILLWRNAWLNLDTPMSSEFREELERLEA